MGWSGVSLIIYSILFAIIGASPFLLRRRYRNKKRWIWEEKKKDGTLVVGPALDRVLHIDDPPLRDLHHLPPRKVKPKFVRKFWKK